MRYSKTEQEVISEVINALFDREAMPSEVESWIHAFDGNLNLRVLISSLMQTTEFTRQVVFDTNVNHLKFTGKGLNLIHIPKTAGQSMRSIIEEECKFIFLDIGDNARNSGAISVKDAREVNWPFLCGHRSLASFPENRINVIGVREPLSRVLSLYRFLEARRNVPEFSDWVADDLHTNRYTAPQCFFVQNLTNSFSGYRDLSPKRQRRSVQRGVRKIDFVFWGHSSASKKRVFKDCFEANYEDRIVNETIRVALKTIKVSRNTQKILQKKLLCDYSLLSDFYNRKLLEPISTTSMKKMGDETAKSLSFDLES